MKGIWKDGPRLFRRDKNDGVRGHYGRERGINGVYGWREYLYGRLRRFERKLVIRGMRRLGKAETDCLADVSEAERKESRGNHVQVT
jgi:hypothetical protein